MGKIVPTFEKVVSDLTHRTKVINDINRERERQFAIHGAQQDVSMEMLYVILAEEMGEVAQAIQVQNHPSHVKETDSDDLYKELIHVAAVAVKMAERVLEDDS